MLENDYYIPINFEEIVGGLNFVIKPQNGVLWVVPKENDETEQITEMTEGAREEWKVLIE